ncbi:TonB-dependent receptor [Novosphingobium sp. PhB165]|uniref:TonB-dependent receptor n=1 Tax=Novosphingobium sp. PhB165 TaxID=2485105 RepID=UPI001404A0D4|nr:TonB-dependent receptor [Novosphingobium sp. PhB165]
MYLHLRNALRASSALAIALFAQTTFIEPALAQSTNSGAADAAADQNSGQDSSSDAIVVTGLRASLRDAINAKRNATVVTETISAKDIGVLPDVTIADSLARLPGVTATRDRGNASQAAVRGLGPRLVLGLINGREVASSEPDRNVRWEIYPSEIVSGVTVYKSQQADLIAGGVAATIDIRTVRPLDYSGPALTVRAGALYNDGGKDIPDYSGWGSRGSAQYVGRLTDNLAVVVGGTFQRQKNGFNSFQGWGYNTVDTGSPPTLNGEPINAPWGAQTEVNGLKETRWSTTGALQWKPTTEWDINLDVLYSKVKIDENQAQQWYGNSNGWGDWGGTIGGPDDIYQDGNYTLSGNTITGATLNNFSSVTNAIAKYTEDKNLFVTGFNAKYDDGDWTAKFDASYSRARRDNTWGAIYTESYPDTTTFSTGRNVVPTVSVSNNPGDVTNQTVPSYFAGQFDGPQRLQDDLGAAQFDAYRHLDNGFFTGFGVGMRYSNRVKSYHASTAAVSTNTGGDLSIDPAQLTEFSVGTFNVPNLIWGNYKDLAAAYLTLADPVEDQSQYWRVKEDNFEGYVMTDFKGSFFTGNLGVRFVNVSTHSDAISSVTSWDDALQENVTTTAPIRENNTYFRALPSLNLNFDLTDTLKLRAGIARVMSRPPLDELRANLALSYFPPTNTGSGGNPQLKPFMANQADLSLEWYFHKDSLFALAGYYKDVSSNIGYTQTQQIIGGNSYQITAPANGKGGHIAGIEGTIQTPFYFIGLNNFGIYANASYVDSNIKELAPASNPFPGVGLTKFTSEVDLWYSAHGIDARVALKHHSPYTVIYGWDSSQLTRLESETTLGASISYAINKSISVRLQANNLTNQAARFYWNNDPDQIARYEKYGRSYLADVTFKY